MFNEVSNLHLDFMNRLNMEEIPINSHIQYKKSNISNAVLQNYCFQNNQFRKVRLSYLITDECQMFNSLWYPSYDYDCPILTIDLVNFYQNKSLCFINFINIYDNVEYLNKYENPFLLIKNNYPELSENKSSHLYPFKNFLSKAMLYGHIYDSNKFNTIVPKVVDEYISKYTKQFIKRPVNRYFINDRHKDYNELRYFIENTNYITKKYFDKETYIHLLNSFYSE